MCCCASAFGIVLGWTYFSRVKPNDITLAFTFVTGTNWGLQSLWLPHYWKFYQSVFKIKPSHLGHWSEEYTDPLRIWKAFLWEKCLLHWHEEQKEKLLERPMLIMWHEVQLQRQIMMYIKDCFRNPNFSPLAPLYSWKRKWLQGAIWRVCGEDVPTYGQPGAIRSRHKVVSCS